MKMHYVRMRFFEDVKKIPRAIRQVPAHVRLHNESIFLHLFAEGAKSRDRVDTGIMALFPLSKAHLRDKCFGPANLHAVDNVGYFHTASLNLRQ
jgi:hypothetical protein